MYTEEVTQPKFLFWKVAVCLLTKKIYIKLPFSAQNIFPPDFSKRCDII